MNAPFERALLLYEQARFDLAENELRKTLGNDPNEADAHALLGLCLAEREQYREATHEAQTAIHLLPDLPFAHYALAAILHKRGLLDDSERSVAEALRLDPWNAEYYALLSAIRYDQRRWQDALAAAEEGLTVLPEHVGCTNLRAMALIQLGRRAEAGQTIDSALAKDPENAFTHSNQGWACLHQRNPAKALEHFREALRLDPQLEMARLGIVEALKARNIIYRWFLSYFLWMSRLSHTMQWVVVLGGYFGYRFLSQLAKDKPALAPWITPILILYFLFAILTWIADPVFNLLLRIDRFGRMALSREQIVASNWVGGCLLAAATFAAAGLILPNEVLLLSGGAFLMLTIPLSGTFHCLPGWPRTMMALYTIGLLVVAASGFSLLLFGRDENMFSLGTILLGLFLIGIFVSGFVANALVMARPTR